MSKSPTGIPGFDDISMGGIPNGRITLLTGGPGSGKTVFALQTLVNGARNNTPGIFVAFEQAPSELRNDAATFEWELTSHPEQHLMFIDARPNLDLVRSGDFDIGGMLALLQAQVEAKKTKTIVFDGIDILLAQMGDPDVIRRELYRLQHWVSQVGLTALITCKSTISDPRFIGLPSLEFLQYMGDCSIILNSDIVDDVLNRNLRIAKYRGSDFHGNVAPFIINSAGIDVTLTPAMQPNQGAMNVERLSSGETEIDTMLQGGFFRSQCVLITGGPGSGKTTLCGAFVAAACGRGEKALYVSFLSQQQEILYYLQSVSIDLHPFIDSGLLRFVSTRASIGSGETQLRSIQAMAEEHDAACIVVDPISALVSFAKARLSPGVIERLIDWAKDQQRTLVCTGLLNDPEKLDEPPNLHISTLSDTWLHLNNTLDGQARKRDLAILKARGTGHSAKVYEFILSSKGMLFPYPAYATDKGGRDDR